MYSLHGISGRVTKRFERAVNTRTLRIAPEKSSYFLPKGYRYRLTPRYYVDTVGQPGADVVAQPDVYLVVEQLATVLGAGAIVDLGCGRGGKLEALRDRFDIVGLDFGSNLEFCQQSYDWGTWVEANLETGTVPGLDPSAYDGAVVVSSDVIEHVTRPEMLLSIVVELLQSAAVAVLSTPERVRTWGAQHQGPPPNQSHLREWSSTEFGELLAQSGLHVAYLGCTRSNTLDNEGKTVLAVCTASALTSEQMDLVESIASMTVSEALANAKVVG